MVKKLVSIIALMAIGLSAANAHHHRGHALYYLERVQSELVLALANIQSMRHTNAQPFGDLDEANLAEITRHINIMHSQSLDIESALRDCNSDLKQIRRIVNQPKNLYLGNPHAQSFVMKLTLYTSGGMVSNQTIDDMRFLGGLQRALISAWLHNDLVLWHVNDAIQEEVYGDDPNAGHEPGFDPIVPLGNHYPRANQIDRTEERHWVICE